jgi:beta-lactamase class A
MAAMQILLTMSLFAGLVAVTGLHAQTAAPAQTALQTEVQRIAAAHHGKVALFGENMKSHETVALMPDEPVQTASVIKLAILYEALEQIRAGKVHFEDKITLTKADQVPGSGILTLMDAPLTVTFKDALTLMIMMSDNTCANLAMDHVGIANVDQRMAMLGLKNTYLYKKVFMPNPPGTVMPDDQKRFGLGKTTAREMATLMTRFVDCQLAGPGSPAEPGDGALCGAALKMLQLQFYRSTIPRYLDGLPGATDDSIASKTGSLNAVRSDVAAISTKNGMVVLAVFTYDNIDHSWVADQEGELTIAKLARAVLAAWSPAGLAPWPASRTDTGGH